MPDTKDDRQHVHFVMPADTRLTGQAGTTPSQLHLFIICSSNQAQNQPLEPNHSSGNQAKLPLARQVRLYSRTQGNSHYHKQITHYPAE